MGHFQFNCIRVTSALKSLHYLPHQASTSNSRSFPVHRNTTPQTLIRLRSLNSSSPKTDNMWSDWWLPSTWGRLSSSSRRHVKATDHSPVCVVSWCRVWRVCVCRCKTCGEYIYKGKKFNARKETVQNELYMGLPIFRFYIKCTRCLAEITFKARLWSFMWSFNISIAI